MQISVIKFGGTSLADFNKINKVSKKIINHLKLNEKIVVVVSAMSGVTNKLVSEYTKLSSNIFSENYDAIISTGEQYSSSVLTTILIEKKIKTRSLLGWQIPIITDSNFGRARIKKIDSRFIRKELLKYDVLVLLSPQGLVFCAVFLFTID